MKSELQKLAEEQLGAEIEKGEWAEAKKRAAEKRKQIIKAEGDAGGARRKKWYLAMLIAESVEAMKWEEISRRATALILGDGEVKKEQPG